VNVPDNPKTAVDSTHGYTPLHAAAWHGNLGAAAALLKQGANVQARESKWHGTPAGWAAYAGHEETRNLIAQGPIDIMEAVDFGRKERIAEIIAADVRSLNRPFSSYPIYPLYCEGWYTPLAWAAIKGDVETVRFLIGHGADVSVRSPEAKRLHEIVSHKGHAEIASLLKGDFERSV